jgi:hypothetical protein
MDLSLPNFHDGYLTGVQLADEQATLFLRRSNGVDSILNLHGLKVLQMEDFREGNIIFDVEVITGTEPKDASLLNRLFPAPHPSAASTFHDSHAACLAGHMAGIVAGETALIVVTPSYGADLVALCGSVTLRDAAPNVR